jgi:hypothetical protein
VICRPPGLNLTEVIMHRFRFNLLTLFGFVAAVGVGSRLLACSCSVVVGIPT